MVDGRLRYHVPTFRLHVLLYTLLEGSLPLEVLEIAGEATAEQR
jgi:hypothetical protein